MKYLIIANGPFLAKHIIMEAAENACIIALDGAADKLIHLNIKPDIILGDLDSITSKKNPENIKIITEPNQNFTDFQKAIRFAKQKATSIHVVCATGGRMDHELAVFHTLKSEYSVHCPIYVHTEYQSITFASHQTITIQGQHHDYCGLFGMPEATMIVKNQGLEYGGNAPLLLSSTQCSVANRLIGDNGAVVEIIGDALIVHPPMLIAQRKFSVTMGKV